LNVGKASVLENTSKEKDGNRKEIDLTAAEHEKELFDIEENSEQLELFKSALNVYNTSQYRLQENTFLNDEIINWYFQYLQYIKGDVDYVYLNTFSLPSILSGESRGQVYKPSHCVISKSSKIFLPVHDGKSHFLMIFVDVMNCVFLFFDSMGNKAPKSIQDPIQSWVKKIFNLTAEFAWINVAGITLQPNLTDCGVFVCYYAFALSFSKPLIFDARTNILELRENIADLIQSYTKEYSD